MEQVNTWIKGIDLDTSFKSIQSDSYIDLRGGTVVTLGGQSSGSIETEKGLLELYTIPNTPKIYKIRVKSEVLDNTATHLSINIDGNNILIENIQIVKTSLDLYELINQNSIISTYILNGDLRVDYSEDYTNISIWAKVPLTVSLTTPNINYISLIEIPEYHNLTTIGSGTFQNYFIVATTSLSTEESNGQIWKFKVDLREHKVITSDGYIEQGDPLDVFEHLIYSEKLNFSIENYITRFISNIETPELGKIYWTDKKNPIGSLNILSKFPMNTPVEIVRGINSNEIGTIKLNRILPNGYIGVGSVVQYFYRLKNSGGGMSTPVFPGSELMYLGNLTTDSIVADKEYKGAEFLEAANDPNNNFYKSIELVLEHLDTNYEFLELYFVHWETLDIAEPVKVAELRIPDSGKITYIHDGNPDNFEFINPQLLNERVFSINSANDIVVKDNRLIAVGVTTKDAILDFDTRAYRFNINGECLLVDNIKGNLQYYTGMGNIDEWLKTIPNNHDCINIYNKEDTPNWELDSNQYKYKPDKTMGGYGVNIEYEFTTFRLVGEVDLNTSYYHEPPMVRTDRFPNDEILDFLDGRKYNIGNEYRSFRSPKINAYLKGYAREEVYRFAFQAYDKTGNPYYASWIADIKMPGEWDFSTRLMYNSVYNIPSNFNKQNTSNFLVGKRTDEKMYLYTLGVKFKIKNLDTIFDKISGYSIGVVERKEGDKTKLLMGARLPLVVLRNNAGDKFNYAEPLTPVSQNYHYLSNYTFDSTYQTTAFTDSTQPNLTTFRSIDESLNIKPFRWAEGDYITPRTVYACYVRRRHDNNKIFGVQIKGEYPFEADHLNKKVIVLDSKYIRQGDTVGLSSFNGEPASPNRWVMNSSYSAPMDVSMDLVDYAVPGFDQQNNKVFIEGLWRYTRARVIKCGWDGNDRVASDWFSTSSSAERIIVYNYKRFLHNQYGGDTFDARQNNSYIPATPFIKVYEGETTKESIVFGGDTCVTYHPIHTVRKDRDSGTYNDYGFDASNSGIILPLESSKNPYLYYGTSWNLNMVTNTVYEDTKSPYIYKENLDSLYNTVYDQIPQYKIQVSKPSLIRDVEYFPAGIFISDLKIAGDRADAWLAFRLNNYKSVDNIYGPINTAVNHKNHLFFFQDKALGIQPINERGITVNDDTGQQLVLGTGELLGKHGYISTRSGSIHTLSVVDTEFGLYYYDAIDNKIKAFNTESNLPLSDVTKIYSLLTKNLGESLISENDTPLLSNGVSAYVDYVNKRIYYNFLTEKPFSICYNENMQAVEHFPYYIPKLGITGPNSILMEDPHERGKVYLHNKGDYNTYFGGRQHPLIVKFVVNTPPRNIKVLTNLFWTSDTQSPDGQEYKHNIGINKIRIYNKYQDTGYRTDITKVLQQWAHKVSFDINSPGRNNRMRSDYHIVEMVFDNTEKNRLLLDSVFSVVLASHSGEEKY